MCTHLAVRVTGATQEKWPGPTLGTTEAAGTGLLAWTSVAPGSLCICQDHTAVSAVDLSLRQWDITFLQNQSRHNPILALCTTINSITEDASVISPTDWGLSLPKSIHNVWERRLLLHTCRHTRKVTGIREAWQHHRNTVSKEKIIYKLSDKESKTVVLNN